MVVRRGEEVKREGGMTWERKEGVEEDEVAAAAAAVCGGEAVAEVDFRCSAGFLARLRYSNRLICVE